MSKYIDATSNVTDTTMSDGACIYKNCKVTNCVLKPFSSIGDFSMISDSSFEENVKIQRNAMIYSSKIGRYTYTGKNLTMWHCSVGAFCSISWNVSIGGANHDYNRVTNHAFLYSKDFPDLVPRGGNMILPMIGFQMFVI